jgi:hypothetical protein
MTAFASGGQVMCGADGCVHVRIWGEHHFICPEDLGRLLFMGEQVSLTRTGSAAGEVPQPLPHVSGTVCLTPSGRAVIIAAGSQRYMLPRDRFLAVAFGEEVSSLFFEVPSGEPESEIIPDSQGCVVP